MGKKEFSKNMQETYANKSIFFPYFFSLFFHPGILLKSSENFFNIMHNLRKLYALKKANKNNIIHIYTSSNSMCSTGIEFESRAFDSRQQSLDALHIQQKDARESDTRPFDSKVPWHSSTGLCSTVRPSICMPFTSLSFLLSFIFFHSSLLHVKLDTRP